MSFYATPAPWIIFSPDVYLPLAIVNLLAVIDLDILDLSKHLL